jgi:hypothetical protein
MGKEDEINIIAHRIWEEEGCRHGHDIEHWLKAEIIWENQQPLEKMKKEEVLAIQPDSMTKSVQTNRPLKKGNRKA